jgi:hypothetical protein
MGKRIKQDLSDDGFYSLIHTVSKKENKLVIKIPTKNIS